MRSILTTRQPINLTPQEIEEMLALIDSITNLYLRNQLHGLFSAAFGRPAKEGEALLIALDDAIKAVMRMHPESCRGIYDLGEDSPSVIDKWAVARLQLKGNYYFPTDKTSTELIWEGFGIVLKEIARDYASQLEGLDHLAFRVQEDISHEEHRSKLNRLIKAMVDLVGYSTSSKQANELRKMIDELVDYLELHEEFAAFVNKRVPIGQLPPMFKLTSAARTIELQATEKGTDAFGYWMKQIYQYLKDAIAAVIDEFERYEKEA